MELIDRVRRGQTEAFNDLVLRYQDRVFSTCWRLCGHTDDARDLTQEAFLKAYEKLSGFRRQSSFYTWLFRIAMNLTLSHRRKGRGKRVSEGNVNAEGSLSFRSGGDGGSQASGLLRGVERSRGEAGAPEAMEVREIHARVWQGIQSLDDEHRPVVVLRDMEGMDYQQIAEVLGIPIGTVKSRVHRARKVLCDLLRPYLGETERSADLGAGE